MNPLTVLQRRRCFLALLVLALPATVLGNGTCHVDPKRGDDHNAGSEDQPWKTIARASAGLGPGDVCLLHAGVYRETLRPMRSGTGAQPIIYRAAGDGTVTVSAADAITGWKPYSGKIHVAPMSIDLGPRKNQIFVDGRAMVEARWPHVPWNAQTGFDLLSAPLASATATAGQATVSVPGATQPADFWRGATVWAEIGDRWTSQNAAVIASVPGSITVTGKSDPWYPDADAIFGNRGYVYLTGVLNALGAPGEWHRQDGCLYLETVDLDNPESHGVEARAGRLIADFSGRDWIVLDGVNGFAGSLKLAGNHCTVQNGVFRYVTHDFGGGYSNRGGIEVSGQENVLLRCIVDISSGNGVNLTGSGNTVRGCVIANVNYHGDYSAAVNLAGSHNVIEHCTLARAGRALVGPYGTADVIRFNDLSFPLLLTQDGGAFYAWRTDSRGTEIAYNWVHDSVPLGDTKAPYDGIYLDDGCRNFVVHHNVVWNTVDAIRLGHIYPTSGHRIYNNTLWDNRKGMAQHGAALTEIETWNNLSSHDDFIGTDLRNNLATSDAAGFADAARRDYRLQRTSPAVDFGRDIPGITSGSQGKAPDAGAYEFGGVDWTPGAGDLYEQWKQAHAPAPPAGGDRGARTSDAAR